MRDLFVRIATGGRISMLVEVIGAIIIVIVGIFYGSAAGYLHFTMRVFVLYLVAEHGTQPRCEKQNSLAQCQMSATTKNG